MGRPNPDCTILQVWVQGYKDIEEARGSAGNAPWPLPSQLVAERSYWRLQLLSPAAAGFAEGARCGA